MAICKRCGGKIKNPKRCPHCGPQQGPRQGLRPVPSRGRGFWEQTMIDPLFGDVLCRWERGYCADITRRGGGVQLYSCPFWTP